MTNCSDGGVVGVVPGIIGSLQAQEAMKIIGEFGQVLSGKLLLYDGLSTRFTTVKLRPRSEKADLIDKLIDYEQFCGSKASDKDSDLFILEENERIPVNEYHETIMKKQNHILLDVRTEPEMEICHLENSINIPLSDIDKKEAIEKINNLVKEKQTDKIILVCRRGNDSQKAVNLLKDNIKNLSLDIKDITGGLHAWSDKIDNKFPKY